MRLMMRKIINWFKPKELHGTYVKYSNSTALENPKMILAEYNRVYGDKRSEIDDLKKADYSINVDGVIVDGDLKQFYNGSQMFGYRGIHEITLKQFKKTVYKKFNVKIHAKKLKEILDQYEKDLVKLEQLNQELSDIADEVNGFRDDYEYVLR